MEKKTIIRLDVIRGMLEDRNLTKVSEAAGVSRPVLYQIIRGTTDPKYATVERLSDYLEGK